MEKYYITTAISYTSGKPHIGNTYEVVLADAIARYKRSKGYDVYFQTGTDEHGLKIETKAKEAGVEPQEFVDSVANEIKRIWDLMDTSYDNFVRTTDKHHKEIVQKIFNKLYEQGDIYKGEYEGWYCEPCESFWSDSQVGPDHVCPDCGRPVKKEKEKPDGEPVPYGKGFLYPLLLQALFQGGGVEACQVDAVEAVFPGQYEGLGQLVAGNHFSRRLRPGQKFPGPGGGAGVV